MEITKKIIVGSLDSADVMITFAPSNEKKISLSLTSPFLQQYGEEIKNIVETELKKYQINSGQITIQDQGALPVVIKARLLTAITRLTKGEKIND